MACKLMVNSTSFSPPQAAKRLFIAILLLSAACSGLTSRAASISLPPSADTSLMEVAPENNNGAQTFVLSGTTQNGPRTRALIAFDVTAIPSTAQIRSVTLQLSVTHEPVEGPVASTFSLHRVLHSWSEGSKTAEVGQPGKGQAATTGETTWLHRHFPDQPWSQPGGAPGQDFSPWESAFHQIYGINESPYLFETTPELVADVQGWVNETLSNFGWLLISQDEGSIMTGRRFGSREDVGNAPVLTVDYLVPPVLQISQIMNQELEFSFTGYPGSTYTVERQGPDQTWKVVETVQPQQQMVVTVMAAATNSIGLFRVKME